MWWYNSQRYSGWSLMPDSIWLRAVYVHTLLSSMHCLFMGQKTRGTCLICPSVLRKVWIANICMNGLRTVLKVLSTYHVLAWLWSWKWCCMANNRCHWLSTFKSFFCKNSAGTCLSNNWDKIHVVDCHVNCTACYYCFWVSDTCRTYFDENRKHEVELLLEVWK